MTKTRWIPTRLLTVDVETLYGYAPWRRLSLNRSGEWVDNCRAGGVITKGPCKKEGKGATSPIGKATKKQKTATVVKTVKESPKGSTVQAAILDVHKTYEQAINPKTTLAKIEGVIQKLRNSKPTKAHLDDLLKRVGIARKFPSKDEAIKAIRQKILSVKGTWDRKDS